MELFDAWPEKYEEWFATPVGKYVQKYEAEILVKFVDPVPGEIQLDIGCGSGIFSEYLVSYGSKVIGVDVSLPMLIRARERLFTFKFIPAASDMNLLPFTENVFDKVVSMTAIEFVEDAKQAVNEMFRVAKPGANIVLTTLNKHSPWAQRRKEKARKGHDLFGHTIFRSPQEILDLVPFDGEVTTAIHFEKNSPIENIPCIERRGQKEGWMTGAFVAARWSKPA